MPMEESRGTTTARIGDRTAAAGRDNDSGEPHASVRCRTPDGALAWWRASAARVRDWNLPSGPRPSAHRAQRYQWLEASRPAPGGALMSEGPTCAPSTGASPTPSAMRWRSRAIHSRSPSGLCRQDRHNDRRWRAPQAAALGSDTSSGDERQSCGGMRRATSESQTMTTPGKTPTAVSPANSNTSALPNRPCSSR